VITVLVAQSGETGETTAAFLELGAVILALSLLARLAGRFGISAIPFYLLAGLFVGEGGVVPLDLSSEFISVAGEIGVLLLLLTLGLEYTGDDLRRGMRTGLIPAAVDFAANFPIGVVVGLALGWSWTTAILLGGVCWLSSSGVVAKLLSDLERLGNRETPAVLNLLVMEDLAMAVYLPVVGALVAQTALSATLVAVLLAVGAVCLILVLALRWGHHLSRLLAGASDESLLLGVFGITLLVGGLAQQVHVSAAIGAFLVGLALSGPVQERAGALVGPLGHLFAAAFFFFFAFQVPPAELVDMAVPALVLLVVTGAGKLLSGGYAAARIGAGRRGRLRAGTVLIARGEFSVVIAALGAGVANGRDLGALTAGYVLLTAIVAPLAAKYADRVPVTG
jgi:monovalent cation:H+ antiporter-2, CPA2 family